MEAKPESPYALSKLLGEQYAADFLKAGGMSTVSLRFFNVFGPGQNPYGPYAAVVSGFLNKALNREPLVLQGDGSQTRDFVYVRDVAQAIQHFMERPEISGVFNIGYGSAVSIRQLADKILELTGSPSKIIQTAPRTGDVRHSRASVAALASTGFRPSYGFQASLRETVAAALAASAEL